MRSKSTPSAIPERPCDHCGKLFPPRPQQVKKGTGRFCSNACKGKAMTTRQIRTCAICSGPIDRVQSKGGPYCSRACSNRSRRIPAEQRYWALVDKSESEGCWPWLGARDKDGYGLFTPEPGRQVVASRFGYELALGPIATGEYVLHHCDNPPCQRPDHWFSGTKLDNARDRDAKGRSRWHRREQSDC
jgi:hypothetical protein